MTEEEIEQQKDIEFYAASVNAYYTTSLEHDKSIFALAAGGIGLLTTLLTTIGTDSPVVLTFYALALFSFLSCLIILLRIFQKNNEHIVDIVNNIAPIEDPTLKKLDDAARASFGWGIGFAIVVGILSAINSYQDKRLSTKPNNEKECVMANEKHDRSLLGNPGLESYDGVNRLNKSFNNVSRLRQQISSNAQNGSPAGAANQGGPSGSGAQGNSNSGTSNTPNGGVR